MPDSKLVQQILSLQDARAVASKSLTKGRDELHRLFNIALYRAEQYGREDTLENSVLNAIAKQDTVFKIIGNIGENSCNVCKIANGMIFPREFEKHDIILPPYHPNCKCDIEYFELSQIDWEKLIKPFVIKIKINEWAVAYSQPSERSGRVVNIPQSRVDMKAIYQKEKIVEPEWYAFENKINLNKYYTEREANLVVGQYGELIDHDGRYWVAVGPRVMNPSHDINSVITIDEMKYGTNLDVVLEDIRTGEIVYLYARVGDVKEHTGKGFITYPKSGNTYEVNGEGIYQTGVSVTANEYFAEHADCSIIEFIGSEENKSGLTYYKVRKIIVYD